jgi:hypothetical protein
MQPSLIINDFSPVQANKSTAMLTEKFIPNHEKFCIQKICTSAVHLYNSPGKQWDPGHRSLHVHKADPQKYNSFQERPQALFLNKIRKIRHINFMCVCVCEVTRTHPILHKLVVFCSNNCTFE